jgi:hypothetical protein
MTNREKNVFEIEIKDTSLLIDYYICNLSLAILFSVLDVKMLMVFVKTYKKILNERKKNPDVPNISGTDYLLISLVTIIGVGSLALLATIIYKNYQNIDFLRLRRRVMRLWLESLDLVEEAEDLMTRKKLLDLRGNRSLFSKSARKLFGFRGGAVAGAAAGAAVSGAGLVIRFMKKKITKIRIPNKKNFSRIVRYVPKISKPVIIGIFGIYLKFKYIPNKNEFYIQLESPAVNCQINQDKFQKELYQIENLVNLTAKKWLKDQDLLLDPKPISYSQFSTNNIRAVELPAIVVELLKNTTILESFKSVVAEKSRVEVGEIIAPIEQKFPMIRKLSLLEINSIVKESPLGDIAPSIGKLSFRDEIPSLVEKSTVEEKSPVMKKKKSQGIKKRTIIKGKKFKTTFPTGSKMGFPYKF